MGWFSAPEYWLGRLVLERGIAVVYVFAFVGAARQFRALIGEHGLLPVPQLSGPAVLPTSAEHLSRPLLRSVLCGSRLVGRGAVGGDGRGLGRRGAVVGRVLLWLTAVGALPVDRQRRPDVVFVRLGVAAAGDRVPGDLPRQRPGGAAGADDVAGALAVVPAGIRCGADQAARRLVLARSDLPVLPPRNPADAGAAELVLPSPAQAAAPGGSRGQPFRAARRAVRACSPRSRWPASPGRSS